MDATTLSPGQSEEPASSDELPPVAALDGLPMDSCDRLARIAAAAESRPIVLLLAGEEGRTIIRAGAALPPGLSLGTLAPDWLELETICPADGNGAGAAILDSHGRTVGALVALSGGAVTGKASALLRELAAAASIELAMRHEIEDRTLVEEQLRHNTLHDALTRLPNRTLFMERLGHAIARSKRRSTYLFAVLFLDLDRFKIVNDSLGHQVGDELLVAVARRLESCLRQEDTVARLGGDEFGILLENIGDISDAGRIAERIQEQLATPVNLSGYEVYTSVSIGIVDSASAYGLPDYMLRSADMAMYRAKASGKARYEMFDRRMHAHALARLQTETDLRRALERGEFAVHYQPVISLTAGSICGMEALLRWNHPERGIIAPGEFIPVAEETGLIIPIGRWVLEEACKQLRAWHERSLPGDPLSVGVNLSVKQIAQSDLVEHVARVLEDTAIPPSCLRLEVTESVIVENPQAASGVLGELKSLGIQLHMDDFGTGYSSLSYITQLPIDAIKIDRSFVNEIHARDRHFQLVKTIITLAQGLGLDAVAEGVTTLEQLTALKQLGCEFAQGFYFSPAIPPDSATELLESGISIGALRT